MFISNKQTLIIVPESNITSYIALYTILSGQLLLDTKSDIANSIWRYLVI